MEFQPLEGGVDEETVEHIRLLVIVRRKNDVVHDMLKCLGVAGWVAATRKN